MPSQADQELEDIFAGRFTRAPTLMDFENARSEDALSWPLKPSSDGTWPSRAMQLHYRSQMRCSRIEAYLDNLNTSASDPVNTLYSEKVDISWRQITPFGASLARIGKEDDQPFGRWCKLTHRALRAWKIYFMCLALHPCSEGVKSLISRRLRARFAWTSTQVLNNVGELITWPQLSLVDSRKLFASFTLANQATPSASSDTMDNNAQHGYYADHQPMSSVHTGLLSSSVHSVILSHFEYGEEDLPASERTVQFMDQ